MMRSLYSGISGLKNHQTRMDVIGNNIANVNTVGYKASRTVFQDIFSQTSKGGSANQGPVIGGTNPMQIGLGVLLSSVDVLHTVSAFQRTDNPFDMMVNGDGFFIVEAPNGEGYYYTRAGNFKLDDEGYLTNSQGLYVLGYAYGLLYVAEEVIVDPNPEIDDIIIPAHVEVVDQNTDDIYDWEDYLPGDANGLSRIRLRVYDDPAVSDEFKDLLGFSVGNSGEVKVLINNVSTTIATLALGMFSNPGGLDKAGNSLYRESNSSGAVVITEPLGEGSGEVMAGGLEMSNVDLSTEFTDMIVTQRGFQANSRVITVSDTLLEELVNLKR